MLQPPPPSTLFPYTTLFRSDLRVRSDPEPLPRRARQLTARARSELARSSRDRKSTRLNSSHVSISYAVFCLKKKTIAHEHRHDRDTSPRLPPPVYNRGRYVS